MSVTQYKVIIKNSAKTDLKKIKQSNLKYNFMKIIETLKNDPFKSTQSFKKLVPKSEGRYSRRINHQRRVVYTVNEDEKIVYIYSCWSHYE
ncbi:Txe/YoeB family addiction module toxin [Nosocomiicoccus ampullae]|uniref:Txe/YoeB family addiction module toxin n=1 Tax=Nosocomiicoccus ampullae TaxID=489910 RepID=UPI00254D745C|nr:Txe/YoeB family addiction module toxin [Nosocomiicoccus ampullae]MDK6864015.1 Txe/YoeB family addiction module toxin [Nosocomiicoccus ampullae]